MTSLGTDGFGRSENRQHLRRHFEVDAESIAAAALSRLARDGYFDAQRAQAAVLELGLKPESIDPAALGRAMRRHGVGGIQLGHAHESSTAVRPVLVPAGLASRESNWCRSNARACIISSRQWR